MDFKETLLLPKTDFEMRGKLPAKEPLLIKWWNDNDIYEELLKKNLKNEIFFLHDGPPYANGNIHVGHALNKILKDFIVKSKLMQGYNVPFIPGWDTHGLPIEQMVTKLGIDRKLTPPAEFRNHCEKYALEQISIQKTQMLRMGLFGKFSTPYITLEKKYETKQISLFFDMYEKGLIFKGLKPIYWSPTSESALAEAEIEYQDKMSPSIYVGFDVEKDNKIIEEAFKILIWTTTPWTIPANVAVAINEKFSYSIVSFKEQKLLIATDMIESISKKLESEFKVIKEVNGKELVGVEYVNLLVKRNCRIVSGHHVTLESGTGLVHIAPSHGEDDFVIGKKENLDVINYVDDRGFFVEEAPIAAGIFWEDANKVIGDKLKDLGLLIKIEFLKHSYPHDWRTKKPVMYKATPQWFCSIDKIKPELLSEIKKVNWIPSWGMVRLSTMIESREDWCISRQRIWGVPIPIIYGEDKKPILDKILNEHIINLFEKHGSNIWFEKGVLDILPVGYINPASPNGIFTKEKDIMDVWFDSGSSFKAVLENNGIKGKSDLYLEGSDQYRGWFNSSLVTSVATTGEAPYKQVLSHGFVLDGKGQKMSKSKGNVIDPLTIMEKQGADVLRLWVASAKYQSDVRISDDIMKQTAEYYRGIRFKIRFALSNLFDFNYEEDSSQELKEVDKLMINKINEWIKVSKDSYNNYEFRTIFNELNNFLNSISTEYFDFAKDILYVERYNSKRRRAIQTVLYHFVDTILRILAPIIPFTTEEAYKNFNKSNKKKSVFFESLPELIKVEINSETIEKFNKFNIFKESILKEMENERIKGVVAKTSEVELVIFPKKDFKDIINEDTKELLMVSSIIVKKTNDFGGSEYEAGFIKITKREGLICPRCRFMKQEKTFVKEVCEQCDKTLNN